MSCTCPAEVKMMPASYSKCSSYRNHSRKHHSSDGTVCSVEVFLFAVFLNSLSFLTDRASFCNLCWPGIHCVAQFGFQPAVILMTQAEFEALPRSTGTLWLIHLVQSRFLLMTGFHNRFLFVFQRATLANLVASSFISSRAGGCESDLLY